MKKAFSRQSRRISFARDPRFRESGSSVVRIVLLCFVLLLLLQPTTYNLQPAFAADSSPSSDIKSKLKELQADIASRAANMKEEVTKKLQNKAYIGTVKDKNSTSLVLSTLIDNKNVNINEFTEYIIKSKTYTGASGLKNITADNTIATLGDIDDKGIMTAKRIIKLNALPPIAKKIVHGIVTSISNGTIVLKTIQNDQFSITFDEQTDYQMGKSDADFGEIKTGKWIIVVAEPTNPALLAKFVYIFPSDLNIKPKFSTPSATQK